MINTDYLRNKKITVVGFARSGLSCANLLYDLGALVSVTDNQDNDSIRLNVSKLKSKNIKVELGKHTRGFIRDQDLLVLSPGVANTSAPVSWAKDYEIPVISEIEVASILCPATIIAVTGSNGKTTVTTLIGKTLEASGKKAFICGNIGNPFSGEVSKMRPGDFVSLEVSSFQLETIVNFKPRISLILNLSRNHLDRYRDMNEYIQAKKRIFMNQDKSDYLVLKNNDQLLTELANDARAKIIYFSQTKDLNLNQAATVAVTSILGIDKKIALRVFREFKGIEHRLEYVTEIDNIKFINDSKSTTVDSTVWALNNISAPVILIAGGRDKGNDYSLLLEPGRQKIKEVIAIGEAREKIKKAFQGLLSIKDASTLEEAVQLAFNIASSGDCILLSPMCSSFDMFANYQERGEIFKDIVRNLIKRRTR